MVDFTKAMNCKGCLRWLKKWLSAIFCCFWSAKLYCFGGPSADRNNGSDFEAHGDLEGQQGIEGDEHVRLPTRGEEEEEDDDDEDEEVYFIPDSNRDFRVPKHRPIAVRESTSVAKTSIPGGPKPRPVKPRH